MNFPSLAVAAEAQASIWEAVSKMTTAPSTRAAAWVAGILLLAAALGLMLRVLRWRALRRRRMAQLKAHAAERRRAERALKQTEVFYHTLVETLPQMILCKDLEGRFTFANGRFCAELGTTLEEIKGKTDFDFFPRELAEKYRADDRRVLESRQVVDVVERHVTPKGETLFVQTMKTPILGPEGDPIGIQGIFWDVTERMRAEERLKEQNVMLQEMAESERRALAALKAAQSRMVQTEKLASLGQLVAGVAHEINNPLAFVSNNVAVLERDLRDLLELVRLFRTARNGSGSGTRTGEADGDPAATDARIAEICEQLDLDYSLENLPRIIERTREGLRRIERIVKDLRLFARVDEGEWNEVDLNPGIDSSVNMVQGYARKRGVKVVAEYGELPAVRCRAARLHQVVVNLLMNAIDACPPEGTVTVRTGPDPEHQGIRIEVSDTGCGIDPAIRERIFDPFFTTKPLGEGTGLGLSISYGIVEEHGGTIEVQSTPGSGSCFTVRVPLQGRRGADPARPAKPAQATG
ncbi:MAG: sensor histidine kinase [Isosphaeraceae bacterium]